LKVFDSSTVFFCELTQYKIQVNKVESDSLLVRPKPKFHVKIRFLSGFLFCYLGWGDVYLSWHK